MSTSIASHWHSFISRSHPSPRNTPKNLSFISQPVFPGIPRKNIPIKIHYAIELLHLTDRTLLSLFSLLLLPGQLLSEPLAIEKKKRTVFHATSFYRMVIHSWVLVGMMGYVAPNSSPPTMTSGSPAEVGKSVEEPASRNMSPLRHSL